LKIRISLREIFHLSWPQVLMMFFHFWVGFVDVLVAGRLGTNVQACIGLTTQTMFFFLIIGMALANGSVAAITQSLGAGRRDRASRFIQLSLGLGLVFGVMVLVLGYVFLDNILAILHLPALILPIGRYILTVYLLTLPCYYLLVLTNAFFRASKMVKVPLLVMAVIALVNTLGDFGLGLGWWHWPNFGYKGLAWSTFLSIAIGVGLNFLILFKTSLLNKFDLPSWKWIKKALSYLIKVAWPSGTLQFVWHFGYVVIYGLVASLPQKNIYALAGMSAGIRIESFLFLPAFAFNFTASILVGHLLGQNKLAEAKQAGYQVLKIGFGLISALVVLVLCFLKPIIHLLAPDPKVAVEAFDYLKYNLAAIFFLLVYMTLSGALLGAGATIYQLVVVFIATWLVRIPLAYVLGHVLLKTPAGIWLAMFFSMLIQAGLTFYVYQYKDWTRFKLRSKMIKN